MIKKKTFQKVGIGGTYLSSIMKKKKKSALPEEMRPET